MKNYPKKMACNIPCINAFSICQNSKSTSRIAFHRLVDGARFSPRRLIKRSIKMKTWAHTESQQQLERTRLEHDDELKTQLIKSFQGTDVGLNASSETRAEVLELISRLEAENPTPAPSEALNLLDGKWILAYTSCVGLFSFLSRNGTFPFPKIEEISQTIDSANFTVQNSVLFSGPLTTTSVSANAKFEVRSPKRVQIKFEEGIIGTPQLTDSILLPEKLEFLGQEIDLTPFKDFLTSTQDTANSVVNAISGHPPLKFPISHAESWLLTTYLDPELRVSRGEGGTVFVLIKHLSNQLLEN